MTFYAVVSSLLTTPVFLRRLSSVLSKFNHTQLILFGFYSPPGWCNPGRFPPLVTSLNMPKMFVLRSLQCHGCKSVQIFGDGTSERQTDWQTSGSRMSGFIRLGLLELHQAVSLVVCV